MTGFESQETEVLLKISENLVTALLRFLVMSPEERMTAGPQGITPTDTARLQLDLLSGIESTLASRSRAADSESSVAGE